MKRSIQIILWLALALTVPLFYFFFVIGGFIPWFAIAIVSWQFGWEAMVLALNLLHLILYGTLLWYFAGFISRGLMEIERASARLVGTAIIVVLLGLSSLLPMYYPLTHDYAPRSAAYPIYLKLLQKKW